MTQIARRSFLTGLTGILCAPAIVRAGSLMPVRVPALTTSWVPFITSPTDAVVRWLRPCELDVTFRIVGHDGLVDQMETRRVKVDHFDEVSGLYSIRVSV